MSSLDVLLVIRACAEHYPPTVNQANLMAQAGLRVGIVDLRAEGTPAALHLSVRRHRVHRMWNSKLERPYSARKRWFHWFGFFRACRRLRRKCQPRVIVAYDTFACVFVPPAPRRYRTVYHFHELPEPDPNEGPGPRKARAKAASLSRRADLVVFPDASRARLYQQTACLPTSPAVVMNCPVRLQVIPESPLRAMLQERGLGDRRVVGYTGSVGINQGLTQAAQSMRYWPADSLFVLVGPYSQAVQDSILAAAGAANAASRVLFLGPRTHAEALALTAGADLGLSLIEPHNQNRLYSAGAVNKRFEYMALGLPQLTNSGPGVAEIVEEGQCGLCVNPTSPEEIGEAVKRLLPDQDLCRDMGARGRELHLQRYNYEAQFAPVLEWIVGRCAESPQPAPAKAVSPALSPSRQVS
ncbi:MAG TPA: glycosyltransferase [Anaerolineae bacterium]|nr:glycosyltransferase [Anaerolineae bacterium]